MTNVLLKSEISTLKLFSRGKVRDIYEVNGKLLIIATDRISAFDVVLSQGIPEKGNILTGLTLFWSKTVQPITKTHIISAEREDMPKEISDNWDIYSKRVMIVKKAKVFPVECIVRGYLAGNGWIEYKNTGKICDVQLPEGLVESSKLPEPIFTPTTKAEKGHDESITLKKFEEMVGKKHAEFLKNKSIEVYKYASEIALKKGIIIADTKFEWGLIDDEVILVDEILTPDSSRFWPKDEYSPGKSQPSFDKQFVRDFLISLKWNKQPPPPDLPDEIISKTSQKYSEIFKRLTQCSIKHQK